MNETEKAPFQETEKAPFEWKPDSESLYDEIKDIKKQLFRIDQEFKERLDMIEEGIDDMMIEKQRNDLSFDFSSMSEEDIAEFRQLSSDLLILFLNNDVLYDIRCFRKSDGCCFIHETPPDIKLALSKLINRIDTLKNKY